MWHRKLMTLQQSADKQQRGGGDIGGSGDERDK